MQPETPQNSQTVQPTEVPQQPQVAVNPVTPVQPASTQASVSGQNQDILQKKIHNAGQSTFLLGCLLAFIGVVAALGLNSVDSSKRTLTAAYLLMFVIASIYWIIAGIRIKRNGNNAVAALATIRNVIIVSVVVFVIAIGVSVIGGKLGAGDFVIILALYLLVAQSRIKKLSQ